MKKPNAADVYYLIVNCINGSDNEGQIQTCSRMIDAARIQGYAFVDDLCDKLQWKRVELIANVYPVIE